jgi:hypothetical protein
VDLFASGLNADAKTKNGETRLKIDGQVENVLNASTSGPFTVEVWLSQGCRIEPDGTLAAATRIDSVTVPELGGGRTVKIKTELTVPAIADDILNVMLVIDTGNNVIEINETNNRLCALLQR